MVIRIVASLLFLPILSFCPPITLRPPGGLPLTSLWVCAVWTQQEGSRGRAASTGVGASSRPSARSAPGPRPPLLQAYRGASSWCSVQVSMPLSSFTSLREPRAKPVCGRTRTGQRRKGDTGNKRLRSWVRPQSSTIPTLHK